MTTQEDFVQKWYHKILTVCQEYSDKLSYDLCLDMAQDIITAFLDKIHNGTFDQLFISTLDAHIILDIKRRARNWYKSYVKTNDTETLDCLIYNDTSLFQPLCDKICVEQLLHAYFTKSALASQEQKEVYLTTLFQVLDLQSFTSVGKYQNRSCTCIEQRIRKVLRHLRTCNYIHCKIPSYDDNHNYTFKQVKSITCHATHLYNGHNTCGNITTVPKLTMYDIYEIRKDTTSHENNI